MPATSNDSSAMPQYIAVKDAPFCGLLNLQDSNLFGHHNMLNGKTIADVSVDRSAFEMRFKLPQEETMTSLGPVTQSIRLDNLEASLGGGGARRGALAALFVVRRCGPSQAHCPHSSAKSMRRLGSELMIPLLETCTAESLLCIWNAFRHNVGRYVLRGTVTFRMSRTLQGHKCEVGISLEVSC